MKDGTKGRKDNAKNKSDKAKDDADKDTSKAHWEWYFKGKGLSNNCMMI